MDSRIEAYKHIQQVQQLIRYCVTELLLRADLHDQTKLRSPEKELFDEFTPKLAVTTYGSDEYKELLAKLKPALDHHYAHNRHHPEFHKDGIAGMNLFDILEMFCDWKAATLRHNDGDILRSIEINQKRFNYSDELKQILLNTVATIK